MSVIEGPTRGSVLVLVLILVPGFRVATDRGK